MSDFDMILYFLGREGKGREGKGRGVVLSSSLWINENICKMQDL